jgi:hypothetical protein
MELPVADVTSSLQQALPICVEQDCRVSVRSSSRCSMLFDRRKNQLYSSRYIITFSGYHQRTKSDDVRPMRSREGTQIRRSSSKVIQLLSSQIISPHLISSHLACANITLYIRSNTAACPARSGHVGVRLPAPELDAAALFLFLLLAWRRARGLRRARVAKEIGEFARRAATASCA